MATHDDDGTYPATWPFRAAATVVVAAMVWFCLGYALEDVDKHLPAFFPIFWVTLLVAGALILAGALFNIRRERTRKAA